jgi:hypothetical protein
VLTIVRNVGRFVEARFSGNPTEGDIAEWVRACEACLKACVAQTGKAAICCTDLRSSALFSPSATDGLIAMMRTDNKAVERNGILGTGGATFTLQLQRMLRESSGEHRRRLFTDIDGVLNWLDESLSPAERARLRDFVREADMDGAVGRAPTENPRGGHVGRGSRATEQPNRGAPSSDDSGAGGPKAGRGTETGSDAGARRLRALKGGRS